MVRAARASVSSRCAHARCVAACAGPPSAGPAAAWRAALRCRAISCRSSNHRTSCSVSGTRGFTLVAAPVSGSRATKVTSAVMLGSDLWLWPSVSRMSREDEPVYTTWPAASAGSVVSVASGAAGMHFVLPQSWGTVCVGACGTNLASELKDWQW